MVFTTLPVQARAHDMAPLGELPLCPLMCWTLFLQSFESWMHKWLLFQMAKNPKSEDRKAIPAEKGTGDGTAELGSGSVGMGHLTGNQALPPVTDLLVQWGACFVTIRTSQGHRCL